MQLVGFMVALVAVFWLYDRWSRGDEAVPLRARDDARKMGAVGNGIAEQLPFLGQQVLRIPPPPPLVEYEPEANEHTLVLDRPPTDEGPRTG